MNKEQLDAIANRKTTCHTWEETVSISRAERAELVAMARRYAWLRDGVLVDGEVNDSLYVHVDRPDWPNRWALVGVELDHAIDSAMAEKIGNRAGCSCAACRPHSVEMRMILCSTCGNKRCPHATDHRNPCTGSNEPGQPGSSY